MSTNQDMASCVYVLDCQFVLKGKQCFPSVHMHHLVNVNYKVSNV